jgi:hypothetical protein
VNLTILFAGIAALCSLAGIWVISNRVAFISGELSQKIQANTNGLEVHTETIREQGDRLNVAEVKIGRIEGWKDGFEAAARIKATSQGG